MSESLEQSLTGHTEHINALKATLVSGCADRMIKIWDK